MKRARFFVLNTAISAAAEGFTPYYIMPKWSSRCSSVPEGFWIHHVDACYRRAHRLRRVNVPCPDEIANLVFNERFLREVERLEDDYIPLWTRAEMSNDLRDFVKSIEPIVDAGLDRLERDGHCIMVGSSVVCFPPVVWCPHFEVRASGIYELRMQFFPCLLRCEPYGLVIPLQLRDLLIRAGVRGVTFFSPLVRVPVEYPPALDFKERSDWPVYMPYCREGLAKYRRGEWDNDFCLMEVLEQRIYGSTDFPPCGACGAPMTHRLAPGSPRAEVFEPFGAGSPDIFVAPDFLFIISERLHRIFRQVGIDGMIEVESGMERTEIKKIIIRGRK
ncbi:MAG: hypothetical protein KatS3mg110_3326 [Pirellulaceae bacterium]|nr:MAG: hypothetical protein KatS3mg110_3326 [Pirellulaceae bacterium]